MNLYVYNVNRQRIEYWTYLPGNVYVKKDFKRIRILENVRGAINSMGNVYLCVL